MQIDRQKMIEHLSRVVTFPTLSKDVEKEIDFSTFYAMQDYLKEAYPLLHQNLTCERIGHAGVLYLWKGTGKSSAKPLLWMAHQDVVPTGDPEKWTYPPFSGTVADNRIWGRGADDCKANIISQMETVEALLAEGFQPDFDLYLFYGYNEEVSGGDSTPSPVLLARLLKERGIRLGGLLDEGGGPSDGAASGYDATLCGIAVAEKGYADFEISRKDPGGHSSRPHKEGGLYYIAKAILAIEENPYPYRIIKPVAQRFEALAPYMQDKERAALLCDVYGNWEKLLPLIDSDPGLGAYFHTTMIPTMAKGSQQGNILPDYSSIVVNCRLLAGDTLSSVRKHLESILPQGMEIRLIKGNDPSPFSEGGELFDLIAKISEERTKEAGKPFVVYADMMAGGTDAKFLYDVCDHCYRFSSFYPRNKEMQSRGIHNIDESIHVDTLCDGPWFYEKLLKTYGKEQ